MKRLAIDRFSVSLKSAILASATLLALGGPVEAQQVTNVPRIGLLLSSSTAETASFIDAFRQGLRELGYVEGKNIVVEVRGGGAKPDRLSELAAELVRLKVEIIVAEGALRSVLPRKRPIQFLLS